MPRNNSLKMGELTDAYYYILLSLIKPKHGYLIMKSIEQISQGSFSIGPASLYTSIKKLLDGDLIKLNGDSQEKKVYIITDIGNAVFYILCFICILLGIFICLKK